MMDLQEYLKSNPFLLAPMAGITDSSFRHFMRELGGGILTTELISAASLLHMNEKVKKLLHFDSFQKPIGVQIFGDDPDQMAIAASIVSELDFDFIDINLGCPVNKVVKKGAGAALLKDLPRLAQIFKKIKKSTKLPVSAKTRLGWDNSSINALEVAKMAADEGLIWLTLHGRTRSAGYSGEVNWEMLEEINHQSPIPIIGNGDIDSAEFAVDKIKKGFMGVMIGRGCLTNPWIFEQANTLRNGHSKSISYDFQQLFIKLRGLLENHDKSGWAFIQMRKIAAWYSHGQANSANFRKKIFTTKDIEELMTLVIEYFSSPLVRDGKEKPLFLSGHG